MIRMRLVVVLALAWTPLGAINSSAQAPGTDAARPTERERALEARIAELERRLDELTARLDAQVSGSAPAPASPPVQTAPRVASSSTADSSFGKRVFLGGAIEGYYEYNWNDPADRTNALHVYDTRARTFGIQQADLVVDAGPDVAHGRRYGVRADLQFGQAVDTLQGNVANEPRPELYRYLWQAFGSYVLPLGRGLQIDFGKFASSLGYETNYAKDNPNFSRALLFNFLPYYHSGFRASLPVNGRLTIQYMITNGVQQTESFNGFTSQHVSAVLKPVATLSWTVNYFFGRQGANPVVSARPDAMLHIFDTYLAFTPTPRVLVAVDASRTTSHAAAPASALDGVGLYGRYQLTTPLAIAVRFERLGDEALFTPIDQRLEETTLTSEYKFADGFLVRAEFRRDWSNRLFFPGARQGDLRDHQNTLLLGMVWWVGNKQGSW